MNNIRFKHTQQHRLKSSASSKTQVLSTTCVAKPRPTVARYKANDTHYRTLCCRAVLLLFLVLKVTRRVSNELYNKYTDIKAEIRDAKPGPNTNARRCTDGLNNCWPNVLFVVWTINDAALSDLLSNLWVHYRTVLRIPPYSRCCFTLHLLLLRTVTVITQQENPG